jgi:hypothetical protein
VVEKLLSVGPILYTNFPGGSRLAEQNGGSVLRSPFSLEELRDAVAAALHETR